MKKINLQLFSNTYDFSSAAPKAVAGKDILLCIYDATATKLLAISGQQGLTINRSADSIEITSKDTVGGWKSKISGMKEWSIDNDGIFALGDESHTELSRAFDSGDPVSIKVINGKTKKGMFGGLAVITDYPLEAPYDDSMTYSLTLEGMGALVDLTLNPEVPDVMPSVAKSLERLTVVSVAGTTKGSSLVYVNPCTKEAGNVYKMKNGVAPLSYPAYEETVSGNDWDGTAEIQATLGEQIMVIECTKDGKAVKAGVAVATVKG